jgi:hypothetical protein
MCSAYFAIFSEDFSHSPHPRPRLLTLLQLEERMGVKVVRGDRGESLIRQKE